ncbi:hypothetical protein ACIHCQ_35190 [Streptomyces sp. NPDC052236]|uniref:hypothetical protein n=1 Tax=Streptomyces sp. NPDC052236 TaxID=3365686 RepID=UPI0037D71911
MTAGVVVLAPLYGGSSLKGGEGVAEREQRPFPQMGTVSVVRVCVPAVFRLGPCPFAMFAEPVTASIAISFSDRGRDVRLVGVRVGAEEL